MAGMRDLGGGFEVPDFRSFVLFPGQYTIVDAWHTVGGRGTGSQDIIVDDAFVPQHRTQSHVDYFIDAPLPGWEVNDGPLYRLPWSVVFNAELHHAGSGRSIYQNHELQRGFQDVQGFLGHTFLVADDIGRDFGAMRMGGGFVGAML